MTDKKISELTSGTPTDTDVIPFVDGTANETKKVTRSSLLYHEEDLSASISPGNLDFTTAHTPKYVIIDYKHCIAGKGFTYSGGAIHIDATMEPASDGHVINYY